MDQEWEYKEKLYYLRTWCLWTRIIPNASGIHQLSLKILIFILLIFLLFLVHNRITLLNFLMSLMPDQRQSVEYLANYFIFIIFGFHFYLFMHMPTFLKKTISILYLIWRLMGPWSQQAVVVAPDAQQQMWLQNQYFFLNPKTPTGDGGYSLQLRGTNNSGFCCKGSNTSIQMSHWHCLMWQPWLKYVVGSHHHKHGGLNKVSKTITRGMGFVCNIPRWRVLAIIWHHTNASALSCPVFCNQRGHNTWSMSHGREGGDLTFDISKSHLVMASKLTSFIWPTLSMWSFMACMCSACAPLSTPLMRAM